MEPSQGEGAPSAVPSRDRPIREAIDDQAIRNEIYVSWGGIWEAVFGVLLCAAIWLASALHWRFSAPSGSALVGLFGALAIWYGAAIVALRRGRGTWFLPRASPLLEASFPVVFMWVEAVVVTPRFAAFGSSGPLLFAAAFGLGIIRLRWQLPLVVGILGGVEYAALVHWELIPGLASADAALMYGTPLFLYVRPGVVALMGLTAALITQRLRAGMAEVHRQVRSQELFGKYRLVARIAAGGMGEVFRASYSSEGGFERPVAIKRIHPHLAANPSFVDAFRREAQLSSRLTHPNIVQVLDFGTEGGGYYLAMEYVQGVSLQALMAQAQLDGELLPAGLVAWIGRQIALGLAFAHTEARDPAGKPLRIIHRDLSPANVLLSRAGEVKLTDFGVAKALGEKEETLTSSVAGKLSYMAPEQATAQGLDVRCDLFALGVVVWEAVTGQRLFRAPTDAATLANVLTLSIPPPSQLRPELRGGAWDEVLGRALERTKEQRFQSAESMAAALEQLAAPTDGAGPEQLAAWVVRASPRNSPPMPAAVPLGRSEPLSATVRAPRDGQGAGH
ncbi:MAG TPA: serine/threonine-protein kinase [Myxococcales bacterium]|nr:serine/threonine-protein kinase [Myxococcales bacterium]